MQRTWHELRRCARARALPAPAAVLRLVEQGQAMLQHTDRGAEFHQAFASRLQALQRAADGTDVDAWCTAVAQVDALRKAAHRRYR
jgi:XXXCH domain-containing protein